MAHLHPTGHHHHPERPERLAILLEALGGAIVEGPHTWRIRPVAESTWNVYCTFPESSPGFDGNEGGVHPAEHRTSTTSAPVRTTPG